MATPPDTVTTQAAPPGGWLRWPAFAMMTVACTGSIAQLSAMAEYGLGAIFLYMIPALLFLLPVALIAAELATGWKGGVFVWVREGINQRAGFQAIWLQWIQSVALYPSLLSFAAASLAYAFASPGLASNGLYTGSVILVVFWGATMVAMRGLGAAAKVSSGGLILGTIIPAAGLILLMVVWLGSGRASSTPLTEASVIPPWTGIASIVLIISNFIAFAGLEVNAVHVRNMQSPARNYPKAVGIAALIILLMYIPGSISISVAVPSTSLDLNAGAAQAFVAFGDGLGAPWLGQLLSGLLVLGALAAAISWVGGPSRGLLLVGREGFLPTALQKENQAGVQAPILIVQACIVTALSLLFVFLPSVSQAFWLLQSMTIILYLSMYVLLFISAIRLRRRHPEVKRGFLVPALGLFASVGALASVGAICIAFIPPAQFGSSSPVQYAAILLIGVLVLGVPPQIIYLLRRPSWQHEGDEAIDTLDDLTDATEPIIPGGERPVLSADPTTPDDNVRKTAP